MPENSSWVGAWVGGGLYLEFCAQQKANDLENNLGPYVWSTTCFLTVSLRETDSGQLRQTANWPASFLFLPWAEGIGIPWDSLV